MGAAARVRRRPGKIPSPLPLTPLGAGPNVIPMTDATAKPLTRQPPEVIDRVLNAREAAKEARDEAQYEHDRAAHRIAYAALRGVPIADEWRADYWTTERTLDEARAAWQAARVTWYHAMGEHAHTDPRYCCQPEDETRPT